MVILFIVLSFLSPTEGEMEGTYNPTYIENLEIPRGGKGEIIEHTGYTLSYSEEYEVPEWVAYETKLSPQEAQLSTTIRNQDMTEATWLLPPTSDGPLMP